MVKFASFLWLLLSLIFVLPAQTQAQNGKTICIDGKCYPLVSSVVVSESMVATADASGLRSDSRAFKRALLESARQARRSGEISLGQHLAVIAIAQRPAKLEEMKASVHELAIEDGLATATAVDWMKLIEFIIRVLPELIAIFK
ncbi:MAG: hypothetical protein ACOVLE_01820 [Pirellula staleyi]